MSQFGSGFRPPAAPVEEGKVYEAKIEDMGREGDGLCRVANFVVFIPGTKVGDCVPEIDQALVAPVVMPLMK